MKKCPKCNVELPDDAMFCNNCGANLAESAASDPTPAPAPAPAPMPAPINNQVLQDAEATAKNAKVGLIAIISAAAVVIVLILIVVCFSMTGGYKGVIKKYMKLVQGANTEALTALEVPNANKVMPEYADDVFDVDYKDLIEVLDAEDTAFWEGMKNEGRIKLTYEIKRAEDIEELDKLEDDSLYEDLDDFQDMFDDMYDDYDLDCDKIKQVYVCEVKWEFTVDGKKEAKGTSIMYVYKYGSKWYIMSGFDYSHIMADLDRDDFEDVFEDVEDAQEDYYDLLY